MWRVTGVRSGLWYALSRATNPKEESATMKCCPPKSGANLRDCLQYARRRGCDLTIIRGTGEVRIAHPTKGSIKTDCREKSAARHVTSFLKELEAWR
jgi:hypothetical protein